MNSRPVSPHEKAFAQRQAGARFNVTKDNFPKRRRVTAYKPVLTRLMEASGRRAFKAGQRRPSSVR